MRADKQEAPTFHTLFAPMWLGCLIGWFVFMCVYGADAYYYSYDNLLNLRVAQGSSFSEVLQFCFFETNPPLGNLIRHAWVSVSSDPAYVRGLSLLCAVLLIFTYYHIGRALNDRFTGICAAFLVAGSDAIILQASVVRNYTIFLLFLSAGFYCYLRWREQQKQAQLIAYAALALLATLTHFSGIFAIAVIGFCEVVLWRKDKPERTRAIVWIAANALIITIALLVYHQWEPIIKAYQAQSALAQNNYLDASFEKLFFAGLLYAPVILIYLLPGAFPALIGMIAIPVSLKFAKAKHTRMMLFFALVAFALGIATMMMKLYPAFEAMRRNLWIFPFVIIACACILSEAGAWGAARLRKERVLPYEEIFSCIAFVLLAASYTVEQRFSAIDEYTFTNDMWKEVEQHVKALPATSLVITGRFDAAMLTPEDDNIYRHFDESLFTGASKAKRIALYSSQLVFNPRDMFLRDAESLIQTANAARDAGFMQDVDTLVFMRVELAKDYASTFDRLMECKELDKTTHKITGPDFAEGYTDKRYLKRNIIFMAIAKKDFFDEVVAKSGKAHGCLTTS